MCGITGFCEISRERHAEELQATVIRMRDALHHRGPDDTGIWVEAASGLALGHRRLSIIDLSPLGHQPMFSASGRYVIIFNGEIYNFKILRAELESLGHKFRSHSDTEVMLAAIEQWQPLRAVQRFNGMFAFALWDRRERRLYLARDRMGEKPMYYGWQKNTFLFGSELKALRRHPDFLNAIDRQALTLFLRYSYIPGPYSIYAGIHKLPAGTMLAMDFAEGAPTLPAPMPYWSLREAARQGVEKPAALSDEEARAQCDALLREAVSLQMISDVPLGAFLSGGVDSSTIVALMQAQSTRPVRTFTIGFHESSYNEAGHAKAVAQHLGTEHTELYVTPEETRAVIPRLPALYDEPFSDSSQIPTFLVAELARRHVTVSLSGDGGDELFCGYKHYLVGREVWDKMKLMPQPLRSTLAKMITATPVGFLNGSLSWLQSATAKYGRAGAVGDKLHKFAEVMAVEKSEAFYQSLISHWKKPAELVVGGAEPLAAFADPELHLDLPSFTQRMMYLDALIYLPDDILVKVDRASMGVSLESRVPLLDHRLVEFAWQLPMRMKLREGKSKWLLRQVLYQYVPPPLIERGKMGFGVPIDAWLRGPLREWAEALLDEHRLRREGFLNPAAIRQKWQEHLDGRHEWHFYLWDVLMFQAWQEQWLEP